MKKSKHFIILVVSCFILFVFGSGVYAQRYPVIINTTAISPVSPNLGFNKPNNGIKGLIRNSTDKELFNVVVIGKLEQLSPSSFKIERSTYGVALLPHISLGPLGVHSLSEAEMNSAFNNFIQDNYLMVQGIALDSIKDQAGNIKLPPGQYRICFYAGLDNDAFWSTYLSDSLLGCTIFNVCKIEPPQFTQPVSNLMISQNLIIVQPTSPVIFSWTPPLSSCGLQGSIKYELEIREIYNGQQVTDAINNPFIFRKTDIPSTTFLLDLNLYQDILQAGKKYAIRVRAVQNSPNPVGPINNNGYSRVEAFQFGSETAVTANPIWNPQLYFIPLTERKSTFWDDYETRRGKDTLVPIEEYVAHKLMNQGIAYNLDAIELLFALNPELKDEKAVKLYQPINLPVLPDVPAKLEKDFELAHANNITPGDEELIQFRKYLDSLKTTNKVPDIFANEYIELRSHLDHFSSQASQLNRVSLGFVNTMLSELLFTLRKSGGNMTNVVHNHLHGLASELKAIAEIPSSSSYFNTNSIGKGLASGFSGSFVPGIYSMLSSYSFYASEAIKEKTQEDFYAATDQLIPLNVVVYRPVAPPAKPIFDAPDLKGVFRVFYTTKNLYNNRNPEINAKSPGPLASTTQVSLPGRIDYKFWTLNMLTHKSTLPQDIDINELFSKNQKTDQKGKRLTVILKVE